MGIISDGYLRIFAKITALKKLDYSGWAGVTWVTAFVLLLKNYKGHIRNLYLK